MAAPNTGGQLRTKIADMQVGDYIICKGWSGNGLTSDYPIFNDPGGYTGGEIPYTGYNGSPAKEGAFYLIMVEKTKHGGLLIADRVIRNTVTWEYLNQYDLIQGKIVTLRSGDTGIIRSLGGGNSYASANGNSSTTDAGLGAWPKDNEYEKYIVGLFGGADDVWHWSGCNTHTQDTPVNGLLDRGVSATSSMRVGRGSANSLSVTENLKIWLANSALANQYVGFRPVFQYEEASS